MTKGKTNGVTAQGDNADSRIAEIDEVINAFVARHPGDESFVLEGFHQVARLRLMDRLYGRERERVSLARARAQQAAKHRVDRTEM